MVFAFNAETCEQMKQSQTLLAKALQSGCDETPILPMTPNTKATTVVASVEDGQEDDDDDKGFKFVSTIPFF
jgi:hypothetical protein